LSGRSDSPRIRAAGKETPAGSPDVVRHEYLIVKHLDPAFQRFVRVVGPRKLQDALEVERIIHVEMDPEQGLPEIHKGIPVKRLVFLIGTVFRGFEPQRAGFVDRFGGGLLLGTVFRSAFFFFLSAFFSSATSTK
jgi:hypothetical protein